MSQKKTIISVLMNVDKTIKKELVIVVMIKQNPLLSFFFF